MMIGRNLRTTWAWPALLAFVSLACSASDARDRADAPSSRPTDGDVAGDAPIDASAQDATDAWARADAVAADTTVVDGTRVDTLPPDAPSFDAPKDAPGDEIDTGTGSCSDLPLCDDFEGATVGAAPGAPTWSVMTQNCSGTGAVVIDDTQSHSGRRSVKVSGAGGYCNHVFFGASAPIAATGAHVFGRMYVRFGSSLADQHVTFLAMHDAIENKDLRMGGQKSILMWNRESDDATLPELSPAGIALSVAPAVGAWTCVEFEVDTTNGTLATWVEGAQVAGLVEDGAPTPDVDSAWLRKSWKPSLVDVRFGWESYGDQATTMWFDDIAIGPRRIGCGD